MQSVMPFGMMVVAFVFYGFIIAAIVTIFRLSRDVTEIKRTLADIRERLEFPPPR